MTLGHGTDKVHWSKGNLVRRPFLKYVGPAYSHLGFKTLYCQMMDRIRELQHIYFYIETGLKIDDPLAVSLAI